MSYILDALKRADAERERGAVPGLHAQQSAALAATPAARPRLRLWLITATVVTLSAIAAGLWLWRGPATDSSLAAVQIAAVAPVLSTAPATPVAAPTPAPATPPASVLAPAPAPAPVPVAVAPPAVAPAPVAPSAVSPAPVAAPAVRATASKAATPTKPVTAPEPAPAAAVIPLLSELPEDIRRQIPALVITGAVYSETPAQRLLLVNNQVLTQGSQAAPEVSLEEIRPKSSVFSFRGTRFRLTH